MTSRASLVVFAFIALAQSVCAQSSAVTKVYRGAVGSSHIQMTLSFTGNDVTGKYSYDSVGQDIKLTGKIEADGKLELIEFGEKNKPTGKFTCKNGLNHPTDPDCSWKKPDGTRESFVTLTEQHYALTNGLEIVPKLITNRKRGIGVSYPQIAGKGPLSAAAQKFNRQILDMAQKAIADFQPVDDKGVFDTNYNVLLATNDLISIEMVEYYDGGGAHPNDRWWALTYDLAANKELKFDDLFKPGSDYNAAIAKFVTADIEKRAVELEKENALRENRQPEKRDDPIVSMDELSELSGWAMTPKGVVVYFDFPHVIAVFDKNFVPYSVIKEYLKPDGPAAKFQ